MEFQYSKIANQKFQHTKIKITKVVKNFEMADKKYSFEKGWVKRRVKDTEAIRDEIMAALKIKNSVSWQARLYGRVIPRMDEKDAIEAIFSKYDVKGDIWGEATESSNNN